MSTDKSKRKPNRKIPAMASMRLNLEKAHEVRDATLRNDPTVEIPPSLRINRNELSEIENWLFISGENTASDPEILEKSDINYVLNAAVSVAKTGFPQKFKYMAFDMIDTTEQELSSFIFHAIDFLTTLREENENNKCLVHCHAGVSRSVSLVLSYLMYTQKLTFEEALNKVKEKRSMACPNISFELQLKNFQILLQTHKPLHVVYSKLRRHVNSSLVPLYVAQPLTVHNENNDNELIKTNQMLNPGEIVEYDIESIFDSRGCFVIFTMEGNVYIWVGSLSRSDEFNECVKYCNQLKRIVGTPCHKIVNENEETEEFLKEAHLRKSSNSKLHIHKRYNSEYPVIKNELIMMRYPDWKIMNIKEIENEVEIPIITIKPVEYKPDSDLIAALMTFQDNQKQKKGLNSLSHSRSTLSSSSGIQLRNGLGDLKTEMLEESPQMITRQRNRNTSDNSNELKEIEHYEEPQVMRRRERQQPNESNQIEIEKQLQQNQLQLEKEEYNEPPPVRRRERRQENEVCGNECDTKKEIEMNMKLIDTNEPIDVNDIKKESTQTPPTRKRNQSIEIERHEYKEQQSIRRKQLQEQNAYRRTPDDRMSYEMRMNLMPLKTDRKRTPMITREMNNERDVFDELRLSPINNEKETTFKPVEMKRNRPTNLNLNSLNKNETIRQSEKLNEIEKDTTKQVNEIKMENKTMIENNEIKEKKEIKDNNDNEIQQIQIKPLKQRTHPLFNSVQTEKQIIKQTQEAQYQIIVFIPHNFPRFSIMPEKRMRQNFELRSERTDAIQITEKTEIIKQFFTYFNIDENSVNISAYYSGVPFGTFARQNIFADALQ